MNKSTFRKRCVTSEDTTCKEKRRIEEEDEKENEEKEALAKELLQDMIDFITRFYLPEPNDLLLRNFNNITRWQNLTVMNLSNNYIEELPEKFGNLPLRRLDLSQNCLSQFGWSCLDQARIKKTLDYLDISNNSLREIPVYAWKLKALTNFNISHNLLKGLPQAIMNLKKLCHLDASHNSLTYLPISMLCMRNLDIVDVRMNPFKSDVKCDVVISSLIQTASKTLMRVSWKCTEEPTTAMKEYINRNRIDYCSRCKTRCRVPYLYMTDNLFQKLSSVELIKRLRNTILSSDPPDTSDVLFEYNRCYPYCIVEDRRVLAHYPKLNLDQLDRF